MSRWQPNKKDKKIHYQVQDGDAASFLNCKKAEPQGNGWLHYELADGTIGLKRPGTWRVRPE